MIAAQFQAVLGGELEHGLDVTQPRQRVPAPAAWHQSRDCCPSIAPGIAKWPVHAQDAPGREYASVPRNSAVTSAQHMMCSVLAVNMASTLRSGHTVWRTSRTVGGRRLRVPSSLTRLRKIRQKGQLLGRMPGQMSKAARRNAPHAARCRCRFPEPARGRQKQLATPREWGPCCARRLRRTAAYRASWYASPMSYSAGQSLATVAPRLGRLRRISMAISLYDISIPALTRGLTNMSAMLEKAAAHATAKKIDSIVLRAVALVSRHASAEPPGANRLRYRQGSRGPAGRRRGAEA